MSTQQEFDFSWLDALREADSTPTLLAENRCKMLLHSRIHFSDAGDRNVQCAHQVTAHQRGTLVEGIDLLRNITAFEQPRLAVTSDCMRKQFREGATCIMGIS
ncbi:hypothetical protein A5N83_18040 [Rhodococcus sp. 1139]|nr:hypothetical protein A5N83_18040 [Rhodococcus sp. 1139]